MKYSNLPRIYFNSEIKENQSLIVKEDNFHYLKNVLRLRLNSKFRIFNENNGEFIAIVKNFYKDSIEIAVENMFRPIVAEKDLAIAIAIIKFDKLCDAIRALVQIGISKIILIKTEFSQNETINFEKLNKIIINSVQQCERLILPKLAPVINIEDIFSNYRFDKYILAYEAEDNIKIKSVNFKDNGSICAIIGPEGGFAKGEYEMLTKNKNLISVSLGSNILRSEIAAIAISSFIKFNLE